MPPNTNQAESDGRFGTFAGVFTPCTLTILGVIMFLRFGQVVGQSGLWNAVLIVLAAKAITTLTSLSLSAIATNTQVRGGGAYYLISRTLGVEFGGAIGLVFFLAQAISVAMYVIGFTEACLDAVPALGLPMPALASITNVCVFVCVVAGAGWAIKLQYAILATLLLSLVSFYCGAIGDFSWSNLQASFQPQYVEGQNLFTMFALFFPAVTGIMAGANMSGDLKNPGESIPKGTLWAILFTAVVYLFMAVALAACRSQDALIANNLIVKEISLWPALVTTGIFAATLSSALGSMLGAPRILQALATDEIYARLRLFSHGSGPNREPRRATVLTFVIAEICILFANLDLIAPIITMAFMITYGTLNLATFYEAVTRNPSYRPTFRYSHWLASLLGALSCLVVMFLVSWLAASFSILGMFLLYRLIALRKIETRWGDVKSGIMFERTRRNLLKLEHEFYHPKNWRPIVLAFSGGAWSRERLAVYAHWLTSGHGILTLAQVIPGDVEEMHKRRANQQKSLRRFISNAGLEAFPAVVAAPSLAAGVECLVQSHGIGGLSTNTAMFGWPSSDERIEPFVGLLRKVATLDCSVIAVRCREDVATPWQPDAGTIDVWWRGAKNGGLMLLLAHLLTQHDGWRNRKIRLLRMIPGEEARESVMQHLMQLIRSSRIPATPIAVIGDNAAETIHKHSRNAGVVFLGYMPPEESQDVKFFSRMDELAHDLGTVMFVNSAGGMTLDS